MSSFSPRIVDICQTDVLGESIRFRAEKKMTSEGVVKNFLF